MTDTEYHDYAGWRVEHFPRQQWSIAHLLDVNGKPDLTVPALETDGEKHEDLIYKMIDDWWLQDAPFPTQA